MHRLAAVPGSTSPSDGVVFIEQPPAEVVLLSSADTDLAVLASLLDRDPQHNTSENLIANLEETADCKGNWIKSSVTPTGKFTVTNVRNGISKTYVARTARR